MKKLEVGEPRAKTETLPLDEQIVSAVYALAVDRLDLDAPGIVS